MPVRRRAPGRPRMRRSVARRVGRFRQMRRKILGSQKVHWFKEKVELNSIAAPANNYAYGTLKYYANDLTNWASSFKQLFDLYKLMKVKITIIPKMNVSAAEYQNPAGQGGALPLLYIAPNRDPYVPDPASTADVLNDDGCKVLRLDRPRTFVLSRPKPSILDSEGQMVPFQFNVGMQPWLTTGGNLQIINQEQVAHYGHRWAILNQGPFECVFQVIAEYTICFKEQD